MKKFINLSKEYNFADLFLIFILVFFLFILFYAKQGSYLVDVGREAYLPWQMLNGEVLYKDLFNVYGPLGYQINALAYKLFGIRLETLYLVGFLNSVLISFSTYFITKLFTSRKISLSVTFLVISVCVFSSSLFNFIFPYSYNAVYALSSFLISLLTMLLYIKKRKNPFLILSFLFAGFSFANKIEYVPYFLFLFLCLPFLVKNKKDFTSYLKPAAAFLFFPVLSFGILLLQGACLSDFFNAGILIKKLVDAPSTQYFYNAYGLYFNPLHVERTFRLSFNLIKTVLPFAIGFYLLNLVYVKYLQSKTVKFIFNVFILFCVIFSIKYFYTRAFAHNLYVFCWLGIAALIILSGFLVFLAVKFINNKPDFALYKAQIKTFDKMYMFLLISSVLVSLKGISDISLECYGTFSVAVLFMPLVIFFAHYLSKITKHISPEALQKTILNLCFITIVIFLGIDTAKIFEKSEYLINKNNGNIFVRKEFKSHNDFIEFIKKNTSQDSVIVAVPEGAIINFLAQRKSNGFYYYLIPVNIQIFGEEKIISDFKKNPPDYFIVNNTPYTPYKMGTFFEFAPAVSKFIQDNYTSVAYTKDNISFVLYKKNPVVK